MVEWQNRPEQNGRRPPPMPSAHGRVLVCESRRAAHDPTTRARSPIAQIWITREMNFTILTASKFQYDKFEFIICWAKRAQMAKRLNFAI